MNKKRKEAAILRSLIDSKNNFWISSQGRSVQRWDKEKEQWELIPFMWEVSGSDSLVKSEFNHVFALTELRNGNILAAEFNNGIFYYNENSTRFEPFIFVGNEKPFGVVEIFEDRAGKLWFGGKDSFIGYNPISFSFEYKNDWKNLKRGVGDIYFFNINEREDGTFLMCSFPFGLIKFEPNNDKFEVLKISDELEQRGIGKFASNKIIDEFGIYWIGLIDNGILKFDPNRKPFKYYPFNDDQITQVQNSITTDIIINSKNQNELFISTSTNGLMEFNLENKTYSKLKVNIPEIYSDSSNVNNIAIDDNNKIWFSGTQRSISSYDLNSGKSENFNLLQNGMLTQQGSIISSVEYLPKNKLIISSNMGVSIFNTVNKKNESIPTVINRTYSDDLISNVKSIISEGDNLVSFTKVGEAANLSKKITLSKESQILIICLGEGQYPQGIFDFGSITTTEGKKIWSMDTISNTFYGGGGLKNRLQIDVITLEPGEYNINYVTDVGHSFNNFNVREPNNPEWYGIQTVLLDNPIAVKIKKKINDEKLKKNYPDIFKSTFTTISRKYPSAIWIGADEQGIVKYDLNTKNYEQYPFENTGFSNFTTNIIFEDSKGRLWITMNPSGFFRFDPELKEFKSNIDIPDIPITGINAIIEDFEGNLWINSNGGITKLSENKDGIWSSSNYDSKDGVQGGFGGGALISRVGEIYFGTFNGLTGFFPSTENTSPPVPIISNITISDVSVFDKNSNIDLDKSIYETDQINLAYEQNDISFDFAALHYSRPTKNRVSYLLEGFNEHWVFTDKNFASFTNLDPGEYNFKVRAISGYGVPGKIERSIKIIVSAPWYRTKIAYISYFLFFIGIVFGIDRFQRRRLLSQARERMKIQDAEHRAEAAELQARALQAESERKTKELEEARNLQLSMLPKVLPQLPQLDIAVYMKTATEVGGDYYDFNIGLDGTLTCVLGDATGHGMKAGTMVTAVKGLFNSYGANPDILYSFHEISRCIKQMQLEKLSMCMTMVKINNNKLIMSAAGMPPILIYKKSEKSVSEQVIKGMPLGTFDKYPYDVRETKLDSGDTLLLMSDGFPELLNTEGELYGYQRVRNTFENIAENTPEEIIDHLKDEGSNWVKDQEPDDDVTFVVIKVK